MPRASRIDRRLFLATLAPAATLAFVSLPGCSEGRTQARSPVERTATLPSELLPDRHEGGTEVLRNVVVGPDARPADVFRAAFTERS